MAQANAAAYIVRDILPGEGAWRWTGPKPELQFFLERTVNVRFVLEYAVHEDNLRVTGPVTLSVNINGHPFRSLRHETGGRQHFEQPVPASMLRANDKNIVAIEVDKPWTSPEDGARLGFIFSGAGFLE